MKILLPFLILSISVCGQEVLQPAQTLKSETATSFDSVKPFKLVYQMWNHAQSPSNGAMLYIVTKDSLKVYNIGIWDERNDLKLAVPTPASLSDYCSKIDISRLSGFYNNTHVMITSGNEYYMKFNNAAYEKEISMHMYYVKEVYDIITELNKNLPEKLKAEYPSANDL